jgi:hypothetical protein
MDVLDAFLRARWIELLVLILLFISSMLFSDFSIEILLNCTFLLLFISPFTFSTEGI